MAVDESRLEIHGPIPLTLPSGRLLGDLATRAFVTAFGTDKVPSNRQEDLDSYVRETFGDGKLVEWAGGFAQTLEDAKAFDPTKPGVVSEWFLATASPSGSNFQQFPTKESAFGHSAWANGAPDDKIESNHHLSGNPLGLLHILFGVSPDDHDPPSSFTDFVARTVEKSGQLSGRYPVVNLSKLYVLSSPADSSYIEENLMSLFSYRAELYGRKWWELCGPDPGGTKPFAIAWLAVWEENEFALEFYGRLGWQRFGRRPFRMGVTLQWDILLGRPIEVTPRPFPSVAHATPMASTVSPTLIPVEESAAAAATEKPGAEISKPPAVPVVDEGHPTLLIEVSTSPAASDLRTTPIAMLTPSRFTGP
jgi:hypothetical protein